MPIKSKVFIQTLQKLQDRHKISFAFEFNNKNTKKSSGQICPPPPNTIKVDLPPPPNTIRVKGMDQALLTADHVDLVAPEDYTYPLLDKLFNIFPWNFVSKLKYAVNQLPVEAGPGP